MKTPRPMPMGNPADYPIGSPQSRAAARAMLEAMKPPPLSQDEKDFLRLYNGIEIYLCGGITPSRESAQSTEAYAHGKKVFFRDYRDEEEYRDERRAHHLHGQKNPWEMIVKSMARSFEFAHKRKPAKGDLISIDEYLSTEKLIDELLIAIFVGAWERKIKTLPCPFKIDREGVWERKVPRSRVKWTIKRQDGCPIEVLRELESDPSPVWEKRSEYHGIFWKLAEDLILDLKRMGEYEPTLRVLMFDDGRMSAAPPMVQ
jgi:hypothetical protein